MSFPLIGLTTYIQNNKYGHPVIASMEKYAIAIQDAGGVPVLLPVGSDSNSLEAIIGKVDGFLFIGGGDIFPREINSKPQLHQYIDPDVRRDSMEFELLQKIISKRKPFLGICRGLQVINVALGGTLFTHLPEQLPGGIKHNRDSGSEREFLAHPVRIISETKLSQMVLEDTILVNSLHHQGINLLSSSLTTCATAPDGLIEGVELNNYPFGLGVQWHPEWLAGQIATKELFKAFINSAA